MCLSTTAPAAAVAMRRFEKMDAGGFLNPRVWYPPQVNGGDTEPFTWRTTSSDNVVGAHG